MIHFVGASRSSLLALGMLFAATATAQLPQSLRAQMQQPILSENTVKISDHVWAILGFPNVAIIVGDHATLVVDTGLGPRNGATVARAAARLSKGSKLFLTTTHYHLEHATGEPGFPPATILIRNTAQQEEMDQKGAQMIDRSRRNNPQSAELLNGVDTLRAPDILFENQAMIDLGGGVTARLLWLGSGHTKGDELTVVEPDKTLISGDIVQNKLVPMNFGDRGTPSAWIAALDELESLNVQHVLPDHSPPGDGSLIGVFRSFIVGLQTSSLALRQRGVSAENAGKQLNDEFRMKYPDWPDLDVAPFVQFIYSESQR